MVVNSENFEAEVLNADKPVVVDFYADWCGPCQMMGPILEEISKENSNIKICKVNVDNEQALAEKYGIMSIPAFILFNEGKVQKQTVGAMSKSDFLNFIG